MDFDHDGNMVEWTEVAEEAEEVEEAEAEAPAAASAAGGAGSGGLPQGWQYVTPEEGHAYYWHPESGQVAWQAPSVAAGSGSEGSAVAEVGGAQVGGAEVGGGWQPITDARGLTYYWHAATDEARCATLPCHCLAANPSPRQPAAPPPRRRPSCPSCSASDRMVAWLHGR